MLYINDERCCVRGLLSSIVLGLVSNCYDERMALEVGACLEFVWCDCLKRLRRARSESEFQRKRIVDRVVTNFSCS